jgi:hypothetical protein
MIRPLPTLPAVAAGLLYEPDIGTGRVRGRFTGDRLSFDVYWPNGSVGAYRGRVAGDDFIRDGFTYDRRHPGSRAAWHSSPPMDCSGD